MATGPKGHIVHGVYIEKARRDDVASVSAAAKPAVEAEDDGGELDSCSCCCCCWCCCCCIPAGLGSIAPKAPASFVCLAALVCWVLRATISTVILQGCSRVPRRRTPGRLRGLTAAVGGLMGILRMNEPQSSMPWPGPSLGSSNGIPGALCVSGKYEVVPWQQPSPPPLPPTCDRRWGPG